MDKRILISKEIEDFYTHTSEEDRLKLGLGPLEFERNKELIEKFLHPSFKTVIDVGGGPGMYSEWLSHKKLDVYLIDPVEKHIKQAGKRAGKLKNPFKYLLGEAQKLDLPDGFADLVILHGPLYHLQEKIERLQSIREARRVLKKDGILLGFAINYTASTIVGLLKGVIHNAEFYKMCKEELISGIHNPIQNVQGMLPKAYYHKPEELLEELQQGGFEYIDTYAVEGVIWLDGNYFETRSDPKKQETVRDLIKITENDRNLLSLSPHMMIAGINKS